MTPPIRKHLLWDFDINTFDFIKGAAIVIERVVQRGDMSDWKAIIQLYGKNAILELVRANKQIAQKDKAFTEIFVHSPLVS